MEGVVKVKFFKYHGLGNDFIFVEDFSGEQLGRAADMAIALCNRNFGVGGDGLVFITRPDTLYTMRIFNADGTEAEMCGNAIRCLAKHLLDYGYVQDSTMTVGTLESAKQVSVNAGLYRVNMGKPNFNSAEIPVLNQGDSTLRLHVRLGEDELDFAAVSMGNPHAVVYVDSLDRVPWQELGAQMELHPLFPERTNVEFVQVDSTCRIQVRVWERGVGPTLACGTGACAAAVVSHLLGLTDASVTAALPGGELLIDWAEQGDVYMSGPAERVFVGEIR